LIDCLDFAEHGIVRFAWILTVPARFAARGLRQLGWFSHRSLRVSALAAKAVGSARFVRHRFPEGRSAVALKHCATIGTMD
jgi:hypothetical protein